MQTLLLARPLPASALRVSGVPTEGTGTGEQRDLSLPRKAALLVLRAGAGQTRFKIAGETLILLVPLTMK